MPSGKAGSFMNGRKLVYVKLSKMTKTGKRTVCVGDIGQVYCSDPAAAAKVKAIRAASFPKAVRRTAVCGDIMELIRLAQEADPQIQIVNLGETEYAVLLNRHRKEALCCREPRPLLSRLWRSAGPPLRS